MREREAKMKIKESVATVRVVNGPSRADPAHFYLTHGHNGLGIMGY